MSPATLVAWLSLTPAVTEASNDPDRLYAYHEHPSALEAAALWSERGRRRQGFRDRVEASTGLLLARQSRCRRCAAAAVREGVEAAKRAVALDPHRPEGNFWIAANMGALAESLGLGAGLRYRGAIEKELEAVLRIEPAFQDGSADRALGRWCPKVPLLFGGSKRKSGSQYASWLAAAGFSGIRVLRPRRSPTRVLVLARA